MLTKDVKNHINGLAKKSYSDSIDNTMDFVMMFIPIEPALMAVLAYDQTLWEYAYKKRVLLIGPSNLISALKIVENLWVKEKQNLNTQAVMSRATKLIGKFDVVMDKLAQLGSHLNAAGDKYNETGAVTLCFFGDGAARQGSLHETFNMAMTWKLPVVFVCENNGYAMGTSVERTANHSDIWKLGLGYEMPCGPVDGMNPIKVAEAFDEAIQRARRGDGPTFLEMKTYRYRGHSMSDAQHYRTKDEVKEYQKIDPITQVKEVILKNNYATEEDIKAINARVKELVAACEKFADESPYPEKSLMYDAVYEQKDYPFLKHKL